jgi:uncharacterized protein (TIGR03435 family)
VATPPVQTAHTGLGRDGRFTADATGDFPLDRRRNYRACRRVSGPSWLADQGFDIEAKVPERTQKEQLNGMLQLLLEERFGLKVRRGTQTRQGFALVIAKDGPKLTPAGTPLTPEQRQERLAATGERMEEMRQERTPLTGFARLTLRSTTTEGLATSLVRPSRPGRTPTLPAEPFSMPSRSLD